MSILEKLKEKAGASFRTVVNDIKTEAKYRAAAKAVIKKKAKEAYWRERQKVAIKEQQEKARSGGALNKLLTTIKNQSSDTKKKGFSMDINMGSFEPKKKR